jgi:kynurenine 3-monooxygenase
MSGALLALLLAQRGFAAEILERNPDPRAGAGGRRRGPDILSLGERGRHALRLAGLEATVGRHVTAMRHRMIHDRAGQLKLQPYGIRQDEVLYAIRRDRLNRCLLDAAEATGKVNIRYGRALEGVDWSSRSLVFEDGGSQRFEVLIGADGARSRVRRSLQQATGAEVSESLLDAGWKTLNIPPGPNGAPALDPQALHVWPRGGYLMVAMPDTDAQFSAMLFLPRSGDHRMPWGFAELDSQLRQQAFMNFNFPDVATLVPDLAEQFAERPVGLMGTVTCSRWHHAGLGTLIGDAAHTIAPFHGQGVNAAFEDCSALVDILDADAGDWQTAFSRLEQARRADCDAIGEMALEAYGTMRQSMRHRDYLLRKALERELERRHPELFVARYSLVMFHRLPYREACRRGRIQTGILDELLRDRHRLVDIDFERADRLVAERLTPLPPDPRAEAAA